MKVKRGYDALKQNWFLSFWSMEWHVLFAWHKRWKFFFIRPPAKPDYRRLYVGPIEIEWRY